MLILAIETATPWGSLALCEETNIVLEVSLKAAKGSGEYLLSLLDLLLKKTGRSLEEVNLLVAGTGPGSYTGIRIGLAAVTGLAEGLQIPVFGINTLRIIAENARYGSEWIGAMLDARRGEIYAALFQSTNGEVQTVLEPHTTTITEFGAKLTGYSQVVLCGDASKVYRNNWSNLPNCRIAPYHWDRPLASQAAFIAYQDWNPANTASLTDLSPCYLRKVEAEIRLEERLSEDKDRTNDRRGS